MKRERFEIEIITPCFAGGADPEEKAEIRSSSIRGQLRWWFRALGGFDSLKALSIKEQEAMIFGSVNDLRTHASHLKLRVLPLKVNQGKTDGQGLGHKNFSSSGYLTFPIQSREKRGQVITKTERGVIFGGSFILDVVWTGKKELWENLKALISVFVHLGSLGFRSRRAMGALAFVEYKFPLSDALRYFCFNERVIIKKISQHRFRSAEDCISVLGEWLKSWREHGKSPRIASDNPGFRFAVRDHDEGIASLTGRYPDRSKNYDFTMEGERGQCFRPALGLPIIQFYSSISGANKVNWEYDWDHKNKKPIGRFASPVLLRPYLNPNGDWQAIVIFVDAYKFPIGKEVILKPNDQHQGHFEKRKVSDALYETMKRDERLVELIV